MLRPEKEQVLNEHSLCECSIIKPPHMDLYTGQTLTRLQFLPRLCLVREFKHLLASCTVQPSVCQPVRPISWIQNLSLRCYLDVTERSISQSKVRSPPPGMWLAESDWYRCWAESLNWVALSDEPSRKYHPVFWFYSPNIYIQVVSLLTEQLDYLATWGQRD